MKKFNKSKIVDILGWVIVVILVVLFIYYMRNDSTPATKYSASTFATVQREFMNAGKRYLVLEYCVEDRIYETKIDKDENYNIGDKFKLLYKKEDPQSNRVLETYPVFLNSELTEIVKGKVLSKSKFAEKNIYYEYYAYGELFHDLQYVTDSLFDVLNENQKIDIIFDKTNPWRSCIFQSNTIVKAQ